jgi:hypothetical protein
MNSIADLANLISTLQQRHNKPFESDLVRLRTAYGTRAVERALSMSREAGLRDALSVSGAKRREHDERAAVRDAQALFARKPHHE